LLQSGQVSSIDRRFAAGSIAVGELIAEVDDEEGATGLPVLCWPRQPERR
jgi:hypothetical protein